ncbi:radical SAM protein [Arthrobacter sp. MMS18-M83]|uniref:radical SAM protein n=1 Tax=Arthrobacter sp. MMS18-M83 TaxID=2996261 RepID=UPI00227D230B|nr:radical SAM protein [Arthrobacter sp. MMS18-M83]WAH98635.1 radical SAM protein [Arthrobacter sp. MMS18-M83]
MGAGSGIDTFIIKTVEWCNLNCSYCYFYHGQDTSFENRPRFMPRKTIEHAVPKIIEHCLANGISDIHLTLHGGEPLLQPKKDYLWMMEQFDKIDAAGITTHRKITTNAVTLNDEWAELLARYSVNVGISLDGTREAHDSARVDLAGRGSYDRVIRGLKSAQKFGDKGLKVGTISVLNPFENGKLIYEHLRGLGVKTINLVLPEANYVQPLDAPLDGYAHKDLVIDIFDAWIQEDNAEVSIRFFQDAIRAVAGLPSYSDQFGFAPVNVAVLETDGSMQPTDNFRACADGMTELGLSIYRDSFDDLYNHEFFQLCRDQQLLVPEECSGCKFLDICGGGRISTRYSEKDGFSRKTVHCETLYSLFEHIETVLDKRRQQAAA